MADNLVSLSHLVNPYLILTLLNLLLIVFTFIVCFVGFYTAYIYLKRLQYKHIPGPTYNQFFMANVEDMIKYKYNRHELWLKWSKEYGPIYRVFLFHMVILVVSKPEVVESIMKNHALYPKSKSNYGQLYKLCGVRFMGNGIVTETNHGAWKIQRHGINPAFSKTNLKRYIHVFNKMADNMVNDIAKLADGKTHVCLQDVFNRVVLDIICETGFSMHTNSAQHEQEQFISSFDKVIHLLTESFRDPFLRWRPSQRELCNQGSVAAEMFRKTGQKIVREKLKRFRDNVAEFEPTDMMDIIIEHLADVLSEDALIDNFVTIFIAGLETTANILTFLFYLYGMHLKVYQKVQEEVDNLLTEDGINDVSFDNIKDLAYTEATLKETLRLFPPAFATTRDNLKPTDIMGFKIPANSTFMINYLTVQRLNFENGEKFYPERFYRSSNPPSNIYMPFAFGSRSCVGRQFAIYEAKVIIFKLMKRFEFKLVPDQSLDVDDGIVLKLVNGAKMFVTERK